MSAVRRLCAQATAAAVAAVLARYPRRDRPKVVRSKAEKARRRAVTKKKRKQKKAARVQQTAAGSVAVVGAGLHANQRATEGAAQAVLVGSLPASGVLVTTAEPRVSIMLKHSKMRPSGEYASLLLHYFEVVCERSMIGCSVEDAALFLGGARYGLSLAQVRYIIDQLCFERYLAPTYDGVHYHVTGAHENYDGDLSEHVLWFFRIHDGDEKGAVGRTVLEAVEALQQTYATHPQVNLTYPQVKLIVDQLVADGYLYSPTGDDYHFRFTS